MGIFWESLILSYFGLKSKRKCFRLKIDVKMAGTEGTFIMGSKSEGKHGPGNRGRTMMRLEQIETTEYLDYQAWLTLSPNL